jgi:PAS domain S-box-containing protein
MNDKLIYQEMEIQIAELKKQNENLLELNKGAEESKEIYRTLFNSIPDTSILLFDKDLRYIEVGGDQVVKSGFDKSLIKGKTLQEAYPKDVVDLFEPLLQKGFKGESTTFKMQYAQLTYLQQIVPISDNSGDIFASMQIATNITEKHAAEQTLKNSQLLLKSSIESQKDTILLSIDKNYHYLYFNSAHAKVMKHAYGKEIEVGMNILDCITSDEDRTIAKDNYDRALRGETHSNVRIYGKENSACYESFFNPILNDRNEIIGATGLARDISERKKTEEALVENQKRFEKSQELGHVGSWEYNFNSDEFWVSNESKRIYGLNMDSNSYSTEDIENCIPERERVHQALIDLVVNDKKYNLEFEIIPADKSPRKIIHSIAELERDKNNNPLRVRGVIIDITEQKKAEQLLKESNVSKDKFFSIIAHDLRNPFNNIIGFTELLIENPKDFGDPEFAKYLGIINSTAINTLFLLDNLLNWAKSETGQIHFRPEKLILSYIINEVFKLSESLAQKKNIILNYFESEKILVFADQNMISTILRNLISNAIKFTNSDGKIDVYASQVDDKFVEIAVSDNGVGIGEETQKKLFSLASNESTHGTANEKGTGLGLILCKDFVEKQGGKIWVESKLGKGSTFKFKVSSKKLNE